MLPPPTTGWKFTSTPGTGLPRLSVTCAVTCTSPPQRANAAVPTSRVKWSGPGAAGGVVAVGSPPQAASATAARASDTRVPVRERARFVSIDPRCVGETREKGERLKNYRPRQKRRERLHKSLQQLNLAPLSNTRQPHAS